MVLCDSNIFFELFRGNEGINAELESIGYDNLAISDITIGEIYFGMRKGEEKQTKEFIRKFNRYYLTKDASKIFIEIMSDLSSRKIGLPDAMIAAVAKANSLTVFTLNLKDFRQVEGIKLHKPKIKLR